MPQDLEQLLKDVFGESWNRLLKFEGDQVKKLNAKLQELAREAMKDELARLHTEINDLRQRLTALESERARAAADSLQSSF